MSGLNLNDKIERNIKNTQDRLHAILRPPWTFSLRPDSILRGMSVVTDKV